jgi:hypothetical protein
MRTSFLLAGLLWCSFAGIAWAQEPLPRPPQVVQPVFQERELMAKGFRFAEKYIKGDPGGERSGGWYPVFKTNVTGDGWISLGAGYRRPLAERHLWIDSSAAYSWRGYKTAQTTFEVPDVGGSRISVGTQLHWQDLTQIQYFGAGPDSSRDLRSDYRMSTTDVVGFASYRATDFLTLEIRAGRVSRPNLGSSAGTFDRGYPDAMTVHPDDPGFDQAEQPGFVHTNFLAIADTRDSPSHPLHGGLYRSEAVIFSDRDTGRFSFRRYELEGVQAVPLVTGRWTLLFHGWTVFSDTTGSSEVPAYMMPSLGGSTTLRSFSDYRFHDRHFVLASAESRLALFEHIDAALFADAGGVATRVRDLGFKEVSVGAGLRVHVSATTIARVDVAHGREGWRMLLRLNEPFRLNRLSRRNAPIPFVP